MADFVDFSLLLDDDDDEDEEYVPVEEEDDEDDEEEGDAVLPLAEASDDADVSDLDDLIACRTRSKFQIGEVVGDTLHFPDTELDLYDISENDDLEWTGFCNALFADDQTPDGDGDDDDENDPEYIADDESLHSQENETTIVTIPQDEVDSVLDEVSAAALSSPIENMGEWTACFTSHHLQQLKDQFAMYLQLLTQQYLLCRDRETLLDSAFECVGKVAEVSELSERCAAADVENLPQVINLIRRNPIKSVKGKFERSSWRKCSIRPAVKQIIVQNPTVFLCERLIPENGYYDLPLEPCTKVTFTTAEDDLIVLGLEHFRNYDNPLVRRRYVKFIRDLMLPSKPELSVKTRIKNCGRRFDPENHLSVYLKSGNVFSCIPIPVNRQKKCHAIDQCPDWMKSMLKTSNSSDNSPSEATNCGIVKSLIPVVRSNNDPFRKANNIIRKYRLIMSRPKGSEAVIAIDTEVPVEVRDATNAADAAVPTKSPEQQEGFEKTANRVSEEQEAEVHRSGDEEDDGEDDESELAALMAASSTITTSSSSKIKLKKSASSKQLDVQNKQKDISRKVLSRNWDVHDPDQELRQQTIVENFMQKARDILRSEKDFVQFLRLLSDFHESRQSGQQTGLKSIFQKLQSFLTSVHGERLVDDLILFLDHREALQCGKMMEFLYWKRFTSFMRKIEVSANIDSQILIRLFKTLTQLKQNPLTIDKKRIKTAVSKAVNGHPLLMAEFMTLFLDESLPDHLFTDDRDFDHVVYHSDDENEDLLFEGSAPIPVDKDKLYGTPECPCTLCHRSPGDNLDHCSRCRVVVVDNQLHIVVNGKSVPATLEYADGTKRPAANDDPASKASDVPVSKKLRSADEWTPEDDAVLLRVVQNKLNTTDLIENQVFGDIAKQVNKSMEQVLARFSVLMQVIRDLPSPEKQCADL